MIIASAELMFCNTFSIRRVAMRLKKSERKKYKQEIKDSIAQKILSLGTAHSLKWAWSELTRDHYAKLRLDLEHIGKYPIIDSLEADCIDGETLFNTKCYFKHYSDWEIDRILNVELQNAKRGIAYLERQAREEIESRKTKRT